VPVEMACLEYNGRKQVFPTWPGEKETHRLSNLPTLILFSGLFYTTKESFEQCAFSVVFLNENFDLQERFCLLNYSEKTI